MLGWFTAARFVRLALKTLDSRDVASPYTADQHFPSLDLSWTTTGRAIDCSGSNARFGACPWADARVLLVAPDFTRMAPTPSEAESVLR